MANITDVRAYAFCLSMAAMTLHAQQKRSAVVPTLPPTPPTIAPAAYVAPAPPPTKRATVLLEHGQLTVQADNSSLNQILRDVSRQTGMKLAGGVADERVFGQYGPAKPSEVMALLLKGTSSNMLYLDATVEKPAELVLTPRSSSATSPNAFAASAKSDDDDQDNFTRPQPPQPSEPIQVDQQAQPAPPPGNIGNGSAPPDQPPASEPANTAPAPSQDQQSPNGVKTPEQILQELLNLRQQGSGK